MDTAATIYGRWLVEISHRKRLCVAPCSMECYRIGEMPAPNHEGERTSGGSHGDDTDSNGVIRETKSLVITKSKIFERPQ